MLLNRPGERAEDESDAIRRLGATPYILRTMGVTFVLTAASIAWVRLIWGPISQLTTREEFAFCVVMTIAPTLTVGLMSIVFVLLYRRNESKSD